MNHVRLTPTGDFHGNGLRIFDLTLYVDGKFVKKWQVESGQPAHQTLRTYDDPRSRPGNAEPIPEGVYKVGRMEAAGGSFDWVGTWGPGIGDLWFGIYHEKGDYLRSAFGFHLDDNRAWSPGSLGCIVFDTKAEAESFVEAWKVYSFKNLVVDYGFKTVPPLKTKAKPKHLEATLWMNQKGTVIDFNGVSYNVFTDGGNAKGGCKLKLVPRS